MSELSIFDSSGSYLRLVAAWSDVLDAMPDRIEANELRSEIVDKAADIAAQYPKDIRAQIVKDMLHTSFTFALNLRQEAAMASVEDFNV
jgi:hypothetical protein